MARAATGTPVFESGRWKARIPLADGSRVLIEMPTVRPDATWQKAKDAAAAYTERERETNKLLNAKLAARAAGHVRPPKPTGETVEEYSKRWFANREATVVDIKTERQRMRDHILPVLGPLGVKDVQKDDARRLVVSLDKKVLAAELAWKTANNCWVLVRTMFKDACSAKQPELVVRLDDPTDKVQPPDRGDDLERTYLYPAEFQRLIHCRRIPVRWRRVYALAAYTFSRVGELKALRWDAVNFESGTIHFRQAMDRRKVGSKKGTKGGRNRRIPIEPTLLPLLETLFKQATGAYVIPVPGSNRANSLRKHLRYAGITRAELFPVPADVAATWAPLTFHDLRGTGVTWMAQKGDLSPLVIRDRAGHKNFSTTERYLREAEALGKDGVPPFPPLPPELLGELAEELTEARDDTHLAAQDVSDLPPLDTAHYKKAAETTLSSSSIPVTHPKSSENSQESARSDDSSDDSSGGNSPQDVVEAALSVAIVEATKAGKWDVVGQLARELEARRLARSAPNVVPIRKRGSPGA